MASLHAEEHCQQVKGDDGCLLVSVGTTEYPEYCPVQRFSVPERHGHAGESLAKDQKDG